MKALAWVGLLEGGPNAVDEMLDRANRMTEAVDSTALNERSQAVSKVIYTILAMCGGKALNIIRRIPRGNGLESWRSLVRELEPHSGARYASMLGGILAPEWEKLTLKFAEGLCDWETHLMHYEAQSGEWVGGTTRVANCTRQGPEAGPRRAAGTTRCGRQQLKRSAVMLSKTS